MLALTATATVNLRRQLISILGMKEPQIISLSPHKANIIYAVTEFTNIIETFTPILERLKSERLRAPRMIIFCQRYVECSNLYIFFKRSLGEHFTESVNAPDLSRFRLVEMFSSCTADSVRRQIIESFCNPGL